MGINMLFEFLEREHIACRRLMLSSNDLEDKSVVRISRFLASFNNESTQQLQLSGNRITITGAKWLLMSLAMHPGYPWQEPSTTRFVPVWITLEKNEFNSSPSRRNEAMNLLCNLKDMNITVCPVHHGCNEGSCIGCIGWATTRKPNLIAHLPNFLESESDWPKVPLPRIAATPVFQGEWKDSVLPWEEVRQPELGTQLLRQEPKALFEDEDLVVLYKPVDWHCSPKGEHFQAINYDPHKMSLGCRYKKLQEKLEKLKNPAIHAYIVLRWGPKNRINREKGKDGYEFGLCHRLDKETSGPLLLGKTQRGFECALRQIRNRDIIKDYVCLVHKFMEKSRGEIYLPIDDTSYRKGGRVCKIGDRGEASTTIYQVLAQYIRNDGEQYSLVHARLVTGRTHQIRLHFSHIGHPLVCDDRYNTRNLAADLKWCKRLFLHKIRVGFFTTGGEAAQIWCPITMVPTLVDALSHLELKRNGSKAGH